MKSHPQTSGPNKGIILADSITHVDYPRNTGSVVICGSHGGYSAAALTLQRHIKGVIFNDAVGGKDNAGVAGLDILDRYGVMAAAVDAFSAKIGMASETKKGIVSFVNFLAKDAGVRIGDTGESAGEMMAAASMPSGPPVNENLDIEEKITVIYTHPTGSRIVAMDSNSMVTTDNQRDIIMTGSHGGRVGTQPAVKYPVVAAFYNDAGVGKDNAGISRLDWLQENQIIGATVDAHTARIGVGLDTYQLGILSHVNAIAEAMGIRPGMSAVDAAEIILGKLVSRGVT